MATVDILIEGYVRESGEGELVQPTISLVRDGDFSIVVDPGLLADKRDLETALRSHGLDSNKVSHVFLTHQHIDHTRNVGLFSSATVIDYQSTYRGLLWADHDGDNFELSPDVWIIQTPGHTRECASLLVRTPEGVVALTHVWWFSDMTPVEDPLAEDQPALERSRDRVLAMADYVIPGHGVRFRVKSKAG